MGDSRTDWRLAAIVQAPAREDLIARAVAAAEGGLDHLALPVSIPFVAEIAAEIADRTEATVGLSDVVDAEHLNVALAAGAELVVMPIFDRELIELGRARGLEVLPCVTTPNELREAMKHHDGLIGIYPAQALGGAEYVASLRRIFPAARLVAIGGIGSDTAPHYLERGARAVIVDTGLFPEETDPESARIIGVRAGALVELCSEIVVGERQSVA